MSRYLNISDSKYKISVANEGTIHLDTGYNSIDTNQLLSVNGGQIVLNTGKVTVTGDLTVLGTTTTIDTTNTTIKDRIVTLNSGETSNGISGITSGIEIKRGTKPTAQFVFDETLLWTSTSPAAHKTNEQGGFVFKSTDLVGISTNSITTGNTNYDLTLLGFQLSGSNVVTVYGATSYSSRINQRKISDISQYNDCIPNVEWVETFAEDYFINHPPEFIKKSDSILQIFDSSTSSESMLQLSLDGAVTAVFKNNLFETANIRIADNLITPIAGNIDLILSAPGPGHIVIDDTLKLKVASSIPTYNNDGVKLYSLAEESGGTGIFFVNTKDTRDELISRRKALAFSMIF